MMAEERGFETWLFDKRRAMNPMRLFGLFGVITAAIGAAQPSGSQTSRLVPFHGYLHAKPALGEAAPDFVLRDLEGKELRIKDVVGKQPIVIEFGSYS
jgi:hypothetical protein